MPLIRGRVIATRFRPSRTSRMKVMGLLLLALCICVPAVAQGHSAHAAAKPATLMSGFGTLEHPVTTANPMAQKFFNQGLRLIFGFNHDEAARSFRRAAELDPQMAMAYWGIAEAVGPNYNDPASEERFQDAHEAIQKAVGLSANVSASERDYILAMAKRFPEAGADRHKAAEDYRDAMRELMRRFPDDLDAATLFAEAGMTLHPWGLWMHDGTPRKGTEEIVATLESVLKRDPNHMGAIHYYIHAVEASPSPERALAGASRLAALAPSAGHLVHMPSHVYIRTGDYELAAQINQKAAAADRAYIQASGAQGLYPAMYYSHNLHFIASVASMSGNYAEARKAADLLAAHVSPLVKDMPPLEAFMTIPMAVDVRFQRWENILKTPQPSADRKVTAVYWHFARGMALAGTGKLSEAEAEYKAVAAVRDATAPDAIFAMPFNNRTKDILTIASDVLGAKIAITRKDTAAAIALLQQAVAVEDKLNYGEPPDWFSPVRESLGAALLMKGAAADAEKVFREDLDRHPRNPRSLFGLQEALKAQQRDYDAGFVAKRFQASWKGGTTRLKVADLL